MVRKKKDRQKESLTVRRKDRQKEILTVRRIDIPTKRQTDRTTDRRTDRKKTDRQTCKQRVVRGHRGRIFASFNTIIKKQNG